jgi:hypothetical protein
VNKVVLRQQAEDGLRHDLQPGERIAAGSAVTSDPSRWGAAVLPVVALALIAASLASLLGPWPASPVVALALPVLGLGVQFLPRPMYLVVTDRRLIGCRVSRLRGTPGRRAFAVPLADLRILSYRSGKNGASLRCGIPGRKPILLHWGRAQGLRRGRESAGALRRVREAGLPIPLGGEFLDSTIQTLAITAPQPAGAGSGKSPRPYWLICIRCDVSPATGTGVNILRSGLPRNPRQRRADRGLAPNA